MRALKCAGENTSDKRIWHKFAKHRVRNSRAYAASSRRVSDVGSKRTTTRIIIDDELAETIGESKMVFVLKNISYLKRVLLRKFHVNAEILRRELDGRRAFACAQPSRVHIERFAYRRLDIRGGDHALIENVLNEERRAVLNRQLMQRRDARDSIDVLAKKTNLFVQTLDSLQTGKQAPTASTSPRLSQQPASARCCQAIRQNRSSHHKT